MSSLPTADIYVIKCTVTNRVYVGSAKSGHTRLKNHWSALKAQKHSNKKLQRAWNKYGELAFTSSIIEVCDLEVRWEREQQWIEQLDACKSGFNLMHSVQRLLPHAVMSRKLKKYWARRWQDPEYAAKRTEELKSLSQQPDVKNKMQAAKVASWKDPKWRADRVESFKKAAVANKDKLSARAKNLWNDPIYRAKQMQERKARFSDPVFRAKLSAAAARRPSKYDVR